MLNYHRDIGPPRCALKVDIMKAYDTFSWGCIMNILSCTHLLRCIKACITTPSLSISINGELAGFFVSKRGLRQGDPLSSFLFILAMEAFSRSLAMAANRQGFQFHPRCKEINLTHLCFADDMFLFSGGTHSSVQVFMDELNRFACFSGLQVNKQKSAIFIAGLSDEVKNDLLNTTVPQGSLTVIVCLLFKELRPEFSLGQANLYPMPADYSLFLRSYTVYNCTGAACL